MKCPEPCGKIRFESEYKAILGAILIALRDNEALTPYWSEKCRTWHLSFHYHRKQRTKGKLTQAIRKYTKEGEQ